MSSARTHYEAVITAIENLGYKYTQELFDFDNVPKSNLDKRYRIEFGTLGNEEETNRLYREKKLDFWFVYKMKAAGDRKDLALDTVELQQALEDAIYNALPNLEVNIESVDWEPLTESNHMVLNLIASFFHWRNL